MRAHFVLALLLGLTGSLRAEYVLIDTFGDGLTDTYVGRSYAGGNLSWTDLLQAHRSGEFSLYNWAAAGSTSSALLASGQHLGPGNTRPAVNYFGTLAVGANDMLAFLNQMNPNDPATLNPAPHVQRLVNNIKSAVEAIRTPAGGLHVLANVPDITNTPAIQRQFAGNPQLLALVSRMTKEVNEQLLALAKSNDLPVVDLEGLSRISRHSLFLAKVDVQSYLYAPDGFHPSTLGSALLANVELAALQLAEGFPHVARFSDAEILTFAGLQGSEYPAPDFNAERYVLNSGYPVSLHLPEPSSLVLAGVALGALLTTRRKRRA